MATSDALAHLLPEHRKMLTEDSAISDQVIATRGYRSVSSISELEELGFAPCQRREGLLIPVHTPDGGQPLCILRPDTPRNGRRQANGECKQVKYETPAGAGMRLDCPPTCQHMLKDPAVRLWITEGIKKADCLASLAECAVALLGVWNIKGRNDKGGITLLADWDYIALEGREVCIVFDSDARTNLQVRKALERNMEHLRRKKAHVCVVYLPHGSDGSKIGVDDYIASGHTLQDLEDLLEGPRPVISAASPKVEILPTAPSVIHRPLTLLSEHAYAAVWPYCRVIRTERVDRNGEVLRLQPPDVSVVQRLLIVRDDGTIFGEGGDKPIPELGATLRLPEIPPDSHLWSSPAIVRYKTGYRPDPTDVFMRILDVVDRFIDFSRSLASQRTMAELVGCYILSTWFLDAFTVIGYLWPNGERGSGKTQLLNVICELAYLGQVVLSGSSYAAVRDMADYGACVAFDDDENLSNPKTTDPEKRNLLLAGNRKGAVVVIKEVSPDKTWKTRRVDAYGPRLFSSIRLPDPVLASRSIVVPLIRTGDREKANADPQDHSTWPHDRRTIVDDLWALALASLLSVAESTAEACSAARIQGRSLDPWKAILTVALYLEKHGCRGIFERMETLSWDYQAEQVDMLASDLTLLVIRALLSFFTLDDPQACGPEFFQVGPSGDASDGARNVRNVCNACNGAKGDNPRDRAIWPFRIADIAAKVTEIGIADGQDMEWLKPTRVGRVMQKLRFTQAKETSGKRHRAWIVDADELMKLAVSFGLASPDIPESNVTNVTNVTSDASVAADLGSGTFANRPVESAQDNERESLFLQELLNVFPGCEIVAPEPEDPEWN